MTELLERAIAELKTLPADEQDAIAPRLLTEMLSLGSDAVSLAIEPCLKQ